MRLASADGMDKVIKTEFVNPPVSLRDYDWRAWFDGEEQRGQYGYGATEKEAIANLLEQYDPTIGVIIYRIHQRGITPADACYCEPSLTASSRCGCKPRQKVNVS
jgi:hypothetical protein